MTLDTTQSLSPAKRPAKTLIILASLHFLFFFASLIAIPILAPGSRIPNPFDNNAEMHTFFQTASAAIRVSDFLQLASALCLAALSPLLSDVFAQSDRRSSSWLTLAGGLGAAIMLALSALFSWSIVSPGATDLGPALHSFQFIPFLLGGPAWAGFFALFLAGISIGAHNLLPRSLQRAGLFLSFVSALATPVLLSIIFAPCLPIARFLGFIWLIAVSIYLVRRPARA
ncbi:hypothetical protein ACFPT7_09410 [Acidicapsa dinghuensis]|uniref:DUF4386 domain-containing protein n=1 Tax=Acidicapsa dinghuensis TaxID=2218256 RepID=A0ABW1EEK1_9BACT|nr:hypothetical protein [Acidicapsa dinghuensis]